MKNNSNYESSVQFSEPSNVCTARRRVATVNGMPKNLSQNESSQIYSYSIEIESLASARPKQVVGGSVSSHALM